MKYGQALYERSVPQWAPYNIDYTELKHLIKANTTRGQGEAVAEPGQPADEAFQRFEDDFAQELFNQHERVDLFVKSKADEFDRRLRDYDQKATRLITRSDPGSGGIMTLRRRERFSKLETRIMRCGEDIRNLDRFVQAQAIGFRKLLKKYKKWTGSLTLTPRTDAFLTSPKSFLQLDFEHLYTHYNTLVAVIRAHSTTPSPSESSTPTRRPSRPPSPTAAAARRKAAAAAAAQQKAYWNEYDNPSEGEADEPYTIFAQPDASGLSALESMLLYLNGKVLGLTGPARRDRDREREPLVRRASSETEGETATSADDETETASNVFPDGYVAHYATFPSVADQRLRGHRERLLTVATVGCFVAAYVLLAVSALLLVTGRHRLRREVDAGVIVGVMAALLFACLGVNVMVWRWGRVGWVHRGVVGVGFVAACVLGGVELVVVMGG